MVSVSLTELSFLAVLQLFCSSPKAALRYAAVRTLNKVRRTWNAVADAFASIDGDSFKEQKRGETSVRNHKRYRVLEVTKRREEGEDNYINCVKTNCYYSFKQMLIEALPWMPRAEFWSRGSKLLKRKCHWK